jgi:NCK-associated protein 1
MIVYDSDQSFHRLGQLIMDYDPPVKKLSDEFVPHAKLLVTALRSLCPIYGNRNLSAEKWR